MDDWKTLEWAKLKLKVGMVFDIPTSLQEKIWDQMNEFSRLGILDEDDKDGSSENMSFCFDYLLNDQSAENWGYTSMERNSLSKEEKKCLQDFHQHLVSKYSFSSYWDHLTKMLPEMSEDGPRKKNIQRIFKSNADITSILKLRIKKGS